jgi:hypothetical protein
MRITQFTKEFDKIHLNSAKILSLMPHKKKLEKKNNSRNFQK